ncbi:protein NIM1-INTERACTING 2-like [Hibiscus syriacus]|uniref:Protein NIM1-INTERACTING 2-like n=1 Tax=Hibiscus syriacus TaxID=106335 RepID=A0A6A2WXF1_HIBSY|nr:uncharacterized protein LOC120181180 [Hibiscus syriacus]KAE8666071.1 protein NIM1-INTERACTING 2-like [Hibiscus syriacus]
MSFEEEISVAPSTSTESVQVVDLTSDSGESKPDLGYLLEASDDELGLPPPTASTTGDEGSTEAADLDRVDSHSSGFGDLWGSRSRTRTTIPSSVDLLMISMWTTSLMMDCSSIPMYLRLRYVRSVMAAGNSVVGVIVRS